MEYKSLKELVNALSPYLNQSSLARICDINEGQMRQYISGVRKPSPSTTHQINPPLQRFGDQIKNMKIVE
jgi:hypothetical protein